MAAQSFGHLVSFIFGIANDCLVDHFGNGSMIWFSDRHISPQLALPVGMSPTK